MERLLQPPLEKVIDLLAKQASQSRQGDHMLRILKNSREMIVFFGVRGMGGKSWDFPASRKSIFGFGTLRTRSIIL
jgi:hypothetical protein